MKWFNTETAEEIEIPDGLVRKRPKAGDLAVTASGLILMLIVLMVAYLIVTGGLGTGSQSTQGTGYSGRLYIDPTMIGMVETQVAGQQTQIASDATQVVLLVGIQPTKTATPKSTATRNPTPQMPDCHVANVGDQCRFPALRPTPDIEPTATTIPCSVATPDIYSQICIKDK